VFGLSLWSQPRTDPKSEVTHWTSIQKPVKLAVIQSFEKMRLSSGMALQPLTEFYASLTMNFNYVQASAAVCIKSYTR